MIHGGGSASEVALTATNSGTFTVLVSDGSFEGYGGTGTYQLSYVEVPGTLVISPGDQGGPLTNGTLNAGTITVGDIDAWSFTANAGDSVVLRAGALTSAGYFDPWLRVYGPDGALVGSDDPGGGSASEVALTATNSGTFTVLVSDGSFEGYGGTGTYQLSYVEVPGTLVISPGDQGGPLTNGTLNPGTITVGDIDAWSFTANAGDSVVVGVGALTSLNYFDPWLRVYGPDGALVGSDDPGGGSASEVALRATNSGTFTALVSDGSFEGYGGTGTYQITLAKTGSPIVIGPGDEGGAMTNGGNYDGTLALGGLDVWTFTASNGDSIVLRAGKLSGTSSFAPYLQLYGPDGAPLQAAANNTDAYLSYQATNSGVFTVLVSSYNLGNSGTYRLHYIQIPGAFIVPAGDEGGPLVNGGSYNGTNDIGDEDILVFHGEQGRQPHAAMRAIDRHRFVLSVDSALQSERRDARFRRQCFGFVHCLSNDQCRHVLRSGRQLLSGLYGFVSVASGPGAAH